jgi:nicotinamide mononucleotide transporter
MSATEILGFVTGAACVLLAVREHVWTWPVGIANNIFFLVLFWETKLYADSLLQIFYIVVSIYGWWHWKHGGDSRFGAPVQRLNVNSTIMSTLATIAGSGILFFILRRYTDSTVPLGDAVTTALSLTAQWMLGRKLIENWWLWIMADIIYVGLYAYKSLYLTALLYLIFIAMCLAGLLRWQKSLSVQRVAAETNA